jgi:hypothetical protein
LQRTAHVLLTADTQASKSKGLELRALQEDNARLLAVEVDKKAQAEARNSELDEQLHKSKATVEELLSKVESVSCLPLQSLLPLLVI